LDRKPLKDTKTNETIGKRLYGLKIEDIKKKTLLAKYT
jgi:hypothetical protein